MGLAMRLDAFNAERRAIEQVVLDTAVAQVEALGAVPPVIVAVGEGWHPGVIGIVASRLVERFHRPAFVIALDGDIGKGSGRSVRAVDMGAIVIAARQRGRRQRVGDRLPVCRRATGRGAARCDVADAACRRHLARGPLERPRGGQPAHRGCGPGAGLSLSAQAAASASRHLWPNWRGGGRFQEGSSKAGAFDPGHAVMLYLQIREISPG